MTAWWSSTTSKVPLLMAERMLRHGFPPGPPPEALVGAKLLPRLLRQACAFREVIMYKQQMTWQKILCFAALAACALVFLYALGLSTDLYEGLYYALPEESKIETAKIAGSEIYYNIQPFNRALLNSSIVMVLLACLLFITSTHSRRRYYIGNAISTVAFAGAGLGISAWAHSQITHFKAQFLQMDFETYKSYAERRKKAYVDSTFWFDIHTVVFLVVVLVCLALLANFAWKIYLMRAEKKLVNEGKGVAA